MSDYENFLLDSTAAAYNTAEFLRQSSKNEFSLEFSSSDHMFSERAAVLKSLQPDGTSIIGKLNFSEALFSKPSIKSSLLSGSGAFDQKLNLELIQPGGFSYANTFEGQLSDANNNVIRRTEGQFNRHTFAPDEIETKITDGNGKILMTSHSLIKSPLLGSRLLDITYKDAAGKLLGESHTKYYQHSGGPTLELVGGLTTLGGISQLCFRRGRLGLGIGLLGAGITALGYFWPRSSFETTFKRY